MKNAATCSSRRPSQLQILNHHFVLTWTTSRRQVAKYDLYIAEPTNELAAQPWQHRCQSE